MLFNLEILESCILITLEYYKDGYREVILTNQSASYGLFLVYPVNLLNIKCEQFTA